MNILIVKLSAIGDVIHTLPALNALRRHYPEARITWIVEEAASSLVIGHKALDRVLVSRRKQWISELSGPGRPAALREIRRFLRDLRDTRYDMAIDFQALLKSGMLIALCRADRKIGFDKGMEHAEQSHLFLNERIPPLSMEIHALKRNLIMLESLGVFTDDVVYDVPVSAADRAFVYGLLEHGGATEARPLIAVNPVAKWETKLWRNDRFAALADRLIREHDARIVFTGGPEDRRVNEDIIAGMKETAANLAGKTTLRQLAALYDLADLVVSTDTGPMHLAAAMGTPTAAIFGPTAPWRTGPCGPGHQVIRAGLPCSPCFKRRCADRGVACMTQIRVEDVMAGIQKMGAL